MGVAMSNTDNKNIRERLIAIICNVTNENRRFKSLEEETHISAGTWRTFWNRKGGASGEMIESIARNWPQYAFWLATGATDPRCGHVAPKGSEGLIEEDNEEAPEATEYLKYQTKWLNQNRPRQTGKLDLSGLEEFDLIDEAWKLIKENTSIKSPNNSGKIDLSVLYDPKLDREIKDAKVKIMSMRAEQRSKELAELREKRWKNIKN